MNFGKHIFRHQDELLSYCRLHRLVRLRFRRRLADAEKMLEEGKGEMPPQMLEILELRLRSLGFANIGTAPNGERVIERKLMA